MLSCLFKTKLVSKNFLLFNFIYRDKKQAKVISVPATLIKLEWFVYKYFYLQGPKHVITNELSALTRPETGQVFNTAESYLEQTALVYLPKADDSSDALAAEVSYIWLPDEQNSGQHLHL